MRFSRARLVGELMMEVHGVVHLVMPLMVHEARWLRLPMPLLVLHLTALLMGAVHTVELLGLMELMELMELMALTGRMVLTAPLESSVSQ